MAAADLVVMRLDAVAAAHLRRALLAHETWCRAQREAVPSALRDLSRSLAVTSGPERPDVPGQGEASEAGRVLLTYDEAGRLLGVSESTVRRLVKAERLQAVHIGRARRIHRGDVDTFAETSRRTTTS